MSPRDRITKLCQSGIVDISNSGSEASKGDRKYAPSAGIGVCMRPFEVKVKPTYEEGRQAVFNESDDSYESMLGLTSSA